jgi:hypothetical protein
VGATVLLLCTYAVSERKSSVVIAVCLSIISIVTSWLVFVLQQQWTVIVSHACILLLLGFFSISILAHVLRTGRVTADKIYGAICVYLLIGYSWTFAYALLEEILPGSFAPAGAISTDYIERVMQLRYFSFTTLTTLGYGDIVPLSPPARTLATLEAVMGQMYLTVLVARLVGLHIIDANSPLASRENGP